MRKLNLLVTLFLLLFATGIFGQRNFFQPITPAQLTQGRQAVNNVKNKGIYKLDVKALRSYLAGAPMEFKNDRTALEIEIPLPDGKTEIFSITESPVLSPAVAEAHPEIKTYSGNGQKDKKSIIRISLTSTGFNAIILNVAGDAVYFEAYSKSQPDIYFNYFAKDAIVPPGNTNKIGHCGEGLINNKRNPISREMEQASSLSALSTGSTLTTYRLAMPANAEFVANNGGTVTSGFNAVVAYVNRINAFFRNELSVSFVLVNGTNMIYTDANTDPYSNDDQVAMLDENQANCDAVIGNGNYDIGHVWVMQAAQVGGLHHWLPYVTTYIKDKVCLVKATLQLMPRFLWINWFFMKWGTSLV